MTTTNSPRSAPAAASTTPPTTPPPIAELTVNRRQHNDWERTALTELRDGNVATAVAAYFDHDHVHVAATPTDLIDHAIALWAEARASGLDPVLLAGTNELVDRLNHAAIDHLIDTGQLDRHRPDCLREHTGARR